MSKQRVYPAWIAAIVATVSAAVMGAAVSAPADQAELTPLIYTLTIDANLDAKQDWEKNDPQYPGRQWSRATGKQRYHLQFEMRSDGRLEVRNLLHHDLDTRLEAKIIHMARSVARRMRAEGKEVTLPETEAEKAAISQDLYREIRACGGDAACINTANLEYAALFAAIEYPEAMEEDTVPGQYQYFLPFKGCKESSRVQMALAIDGERYNKDVNRLVEFSERRSADTRDASDGIPLCDHFAIVVDTQDAEQGLYVENVFVPSPVGVTTYTERGRTTSEEQSQPMPPAMLDWMTATLRQAPLSGTRKAVLPLSMSLNGNSTWLGLWTGEAQVEMTWSFKESSSNTPLSSP